MTGNSTFNIRLTNVSDSVISAYVPLICPMDRSGEVVPKFGEECFESDGIPRLDPAGSEPPPGYELFDEARPGVYGLLHSNVESIIWRTDTYTSFYLDRFETATQAIVELLSVSFQDGTVCKDGQSFPTQ